ncbi:MAG TPA: hypothetical protein VD735_00630, partial [Candidatus Saccharimonadales bacterium]|nr:hypothetical protein [Candidatus Saccharimonadales bacterium]
MTFPRPGETPWTNPYPQPLPAAPYAVQRPKAVYPGDTQGAVNPYLPPPASAGNEARQPVAPQASAGTEPPPENPTPATHSQEGVAAEAQPLPDNSTHEPDKSTEDATGGKTEVALGSTAMSQSETAPPSDAIQAADSPEPAPSPGRRAVETIREQWRSGIIKSGQINPVIAERYAAIRSKLQETATTWLANNPVEGRRDTEIAKRFANAWLLHSLKSDNPEQYMRHYAMMREALAVYVADVAEIRDMGFGSSAEANAMYVSPAEIEQCFELKSTSRHLTDAAIHRAAENRPRDPVGSVRDYIAKANMLEETFGTRLDDATIRHFASRQAVTTCRNRVEDYLSNVDLLMERYRGHELVTPYLIRSVSRDSENPGLIIENRLAAAEELIGSYEGRAGLTKTMIFQAINNHAEPTKRLDGYIQTIDAVREAFIDYLPDGVIRSLALGPRPIATGRALIAKVESLRAAFHDDPLVQESDLLYFARNNKETGDALQMLVYEYRQNIAAADEYYLGDERMNMELIRRASLQLDGNVIDVLESKLAIMDRLQEQFSDDDVPKWVYRRMVAQESDPEGALRAYLQQKDELIEQFGHVFSPGVIGIAQSSHRDVSTRLAERAPLVTGWWNRYGKLQLVPLSAIQWAAALSSDPETRLAELHGQGLLRAMRDLGRSAPSGGGYQPGYALKQQVGTYEAALAAWAAESAEQNPSRTVNLDDAKRYFSRSLLRYVKASGQQGMYGPD